jgi:hypothetical protein
MPPTGSTFTDWQQVEQESRLLINEDFSWSEPPQRSRRRSSQEPISSSRRRARTDDLDREYGYASEPVMIHAEVSDRYVRGAAERYDQAVMEPYEPAATFDVSAPARSEWDQPTQSHSHFDEMMEQWNAAYGDPSPSAFDLSDPGTQPLSQSGRRTVVITGRGDDRYMPAPYRRRSAELRFHERSTFSPDRAGLWAVLLGLALLIGSIAH